MDHDPLISAVRRIAVMGALTDEARVPAMAHMANTGTYSMGKPNLVAVSDKILPERAPTVSMA